MDLIFAGHFEELQNHLRIDFPTGFSKNEDPNDNIRHLERDLLQSSFTSSPRQVIRVRSLSIQESPFRSCIGGSDCSSRTYFDRALDPNYIYFTMTDSNFHSTGHVTLVLGQATNPINGSKENVAFIDKLQNVPIQTIPTFLEAVSRSLAEKGYKLAFPKTVGDHNDLSNMDSIRHFVANSILPNLNQSLESFEPHSHDYNFKNAYSRAYKQNNVLIFETPALDSETEIRPGQMRRAYLSDASLNRNKLVEEFLQLRNSQKLEDILKFISSAELVKQLDELRLYTTYNFDRDVRKLLDRKDLSFPTRKLVALNRIIDNFEKNNTVYLDNLVPIFKSFSDSERKELAGEIILWSKSPLKKQRAFAEKLLQIWLDATEHGTLKNLEVLIGYRFFDVNFRDASGVSALLRAIYYEQKSVVDWLINKPSLELSKKEALGYTDLEHARMLGKTAMADSIEKKRPESKSRKFKVLERNRDGSPIIAFVDIPGGSFGIGAKRFASATISRSFSMLSTPTTQTMWQGVVELANTHLSGKYPLNANPSHFKFEKPKVRWFNKVLPFKKRELSNLPIESVSFKEVILWLQAINKLSNLSDSSVHEVLAQLFPGHKKGSFYDLPTEAQWDFCARNRGLITDEPYTKDRWLNLSKDYAWTQLNSESKTHSVGFKTPMMILGKPIYDQYGNVWEFVKDNYSETLAGNLEPPAEDLETGGRVIKGGSGKEFNNHTTPDIRLYYDPALRSSSVGFRLTRSFKEVGQSE